MKEGLTATAPCISSNTTIYLRTWSPEAWSVGRAHWSACCRRLTDTSTPNTCPAHEQLFLNTISHIFDVHLFLPRKQRNNNSNANANEATRNE